MLIIFKLNNDIIFIMIDYKIIEKNKKEFQMVLNQWKHKFDIEILWMSYSITNDKYYALVKRNERMDV